MRNNVFCMRCDKPYRRHETRVVDTRAGFCVDCLTKQARTWALRNGRDARKVTEIIDTYRKGREE